MTEERVPCCIPNCRRTFKKSVVGKFYEIMCGRHWRMADDRLRRRHKRARARLRKIIRLGRRKAILARGTHRLDRAWLRLTQIEGRLWGQIREDATIKAVMGAEDAPRRRPRYDA